jgi:hypothetical protein
MPFEPDALVNLLHSYLSNFLANITFRFLAMKLAFQAPELDFD